MSYHPFKEAAVRRTWLQRLIAEHGNACWLCGLVLPEATGMTVERPWATTFDHVIPRSRGGASTYENFRLAHSFCNHRRACGELTRELTAQLRRQLPRWIRSLQDRDLRND